MAHLTNEPVPVTDLTGRQDPGKGYIMDEYDILQRDLENLGVFPFAPGMGSAMSELGDMILYSSTARGGDTERVNNLDRFMGLPGTWAGKAAKEFGSLLSMTPEELMQLRRSVNALVSDDPATREAVWDGVKEAGRNYQQDPMALAEDLGPGVVTTPAIAGPRILGKLLGGMKVKNLSKGAATVPDPPDVPAAQLHQDPGSISDAVDPEDWSTVGHKEFLDADEVPPNWNPGEKSEGFVEGKNVDPLMQPKKKDVGEGVGGSTELLQEMIEELEHELTLLTGPGAGKYAAFKGQSLEDAIKETNELLADLRKKKDVGGGESAGAQKKKSSLEQMKEAGMKEPDAGWPVAYNIENFTAQADLGDIGQLLDNAKFSTKRGFWSFDLDPDIGVFDLNAFLNRMGNSGHRVNSDELSVLMDILNQAKSRPSRLGYDSMSEDLYRLVAGPTKDKLSGEGFSL